MISDGIGEAEVDEVVAMLAKMHQQKLAAERAAAAQSLIFH